MRIRAEQYEVFAARARERFREQACRHARTHWPDEAGALGEDRLGKHVLEVLEQARERGWTSHAEVLRLLNLTLAFEADPSSLLAASWATEALARTELAGDARMDLLEAVARRQLEREGTDAGAAPQ